MTTRLLKSSENINGLPIGFQEVEYLETTNQQNNDASTNNATYIDTGVVPDNTTKIECRVQFTTLISGNSNEALFGTTGLVSSDPARFAFGFASLSPYTNFYMGLGTQNLNTSVTRDTNTHTFTIDASTSSWKIDDTSGTFSNPGEVTGVASIYLFARNYAAYDYANKPANAKTYYCKIWKGGSLVRDLIPALNPAGRPCMYDLVGKKAYYNIGTSEFTYGRKIIPVEYLESTGTQYIDTGYIPSNTTGQYAKMQYTTVNNSVTFGCMVSGNGAVGPYYATSSSNVGWWTRWGTNEPRVTAPTPTTTNTYEMYLNFNNDRIARVDSIIIADDLGNISGNYPNLTLFKRNYTVGGNLIGKVFNYKITEGTNLVRDYIPAIDENNVPYMFDKITHTCYLNAGTGTFNYGKKLYSSKVRLYKDSEANKLPIGFKRVEYLKASGAQYIDTGIMGKSGVRAEIGFEWGSGDIGNDKYVLAAAHPSYGRIYFGTYQSKWMYGYGSYSQAGTPVADTYYKGEISWEKGNQYMKVNDESLYTGTSTTSVDTSYTLYMFARNQDNPGWYSSAKIYYCKMWENGVLVRDFIPALDTTNTPCMYDTVTQTAFYNLRKGVSDFTYGTVIPNKVRLPQSTEIRLPKGYTEVEYIQGSGTQYIDTEYKPIPATTKFEFMFSPNTVSGNSFLFGCRPDTSIGAFTCTTYFATGNIRQDWAGLNTYFPAITANNKYLYSAYNNTINLNTDSVTSTTTRSTERLNLNFLLFAVNTNGTADDRRFIGKVYYSKLWDNGNLVRYFIPCLDPNGRPCLWDVVTKKPFYNAGTGEFTYGRSIQQVSYLESSGTQYIDTGIKFDCANTKIELKTYENSLTRVHSICGDDGNCFYYFRGTGNWAVGYNATAFNINSYMVVGDNVFVIDKNKVYLNGTLATTYTASSTVSSYNSLLFNRKTSLVDNGAVTMYYCKIWGNGTLVRDYVPAIDSNNVGFMFDRVTHTIFDNAGTGSFTYGSPVPNKIRD